MAAALATLRELRASDGIAAHGPPPASGCRQGLREQASAHGLEVSVTGPPQLPFLTFAGDEGFERATAWAGECARNGVYLHPTHNWFLGAAHDDDAIDRALQGTDEAFRTIRERDGAD